MHPYSTTSSPYSNQATDGSKNTPSQSSSDDTPSVSTKNDYEKDMAAFFAYYRRSAYGGSHIPGGKVTALPSPTAPVFTPSRSNKAARAEAMRRFHIERRLRRLKKEKEDKEMREDGQKLRIDKSWKITREEVEKEGIQAGSCSPSGDSVGSWTEDEQFIPNIKS